MSTVSGCDPPNTRRAVRSASSSVVTASRRSRAWRCGRRNTLPPTSNVRIRNPDARRGGTSAAVVVMASAGTRETAARRRT